jgi:hypothetical protein
MLRVVAADPAKQPAQQACSDRRHGDQNIENPNGSNEALAR